jgi:polysaccharide biosynthesis protein PslH
MNVLMLCSEIPYPPHGGSRMRVYQFIRALAQRHRITLLAYQYADEECASSGALEALCRIVAVRWQEPLALARMRAAGAPAALLAYGRALLLDGDPFVVQYFRLPAFTLRLKDLLAHERFDLVHVEETPMMAAVPKELNVPVLLSIHNVETWRAARVVPAEVGQRIEVWKLRRYERRAFQRATVCCPTSTLEAAQVRRLAPGASVHVVANGVDTEEFTPNAGVKADSPTLVFTGTLSFAPNAEGIAWFARAVWPLVLADMPSATLDIVGREPPPDVLALASKQVRVSGEVSDVRPYLQRAWLSIVPLLHGGGTRLKILEAMACALPVVSTTIGAEGLDVVDGRDILIADEPAAFAAQTMRLLRDPALCASLGQAGRALVEQRYDWRAIGDWLDEAYRLVSPAVT